MKGAIVQLSKSCVLTLVLVAAVAHGETATTGAGAKRGLLYLFTLHDAPNCVTASK